MLGGNTASVVTLPVAPGTLLVFEGRYSLHRVSHHALGQGLRRQPALDALMAVADTPQNPFFGLELE